MKSSLYYAALLVVIFLNVPKLTAQVTFSFEESDGYMLGGIAGQNGWFGGFSADTFLISNTQASEGSQSLELANTGVSQGFEDFLSSGNFTPVMQDEVATIIDVFITDPVTEEKESYYTIQATDNNASLAFVVEFNNDNTIGLLLQQQGGGFAVEIVQNFNYTRQVWFQLKVINNFSTGVNKYYIDNQLIYEDTLGNLANNINTYFFSIIDNDGAGSAFFDNLTNIDASLSISDFSSLEKLLFYPNPATNILNVKNDTIMQQIELFDLFGNKVFEDSINTDSYSLDISYFSSGIYIAAVTTGDTIKTSRVIKY